MKDYLHGVGLWAGQWEIALIVAGITQPTVGSITPWAGGGGAELYTSGKKEPSTSKRQASTSAFAALLP